MPGAYKVLPTRRVSAVASEDARGASRGRRPPIYASHVCTCFTATRPAPLAPCTWSRIAPRPPLLPPARPPPCALRGADRLALSPAAGGVGPGASPHSARYTRLWPARLTWCSAKKLGLVAFGDHVRNGVNQGRAPSRPLSRPGHGRVHSVEPFEARKRHWPMFRSSGSARLGPCGSVSPKRGHVPACAA